MQPGSAVVTMYRITRPAEAVMTSSDPKTT
jgi:hypothetical protein